MKMRSSEIFRFVPRIVPLSFPSGFFVLDFIEREMNRRYLYEKYMEIYG